MKPCEINNPEEIVYLKGVVNYTELYLNNGKMEVTCTTLKRYEEKLTGFLRVSKSHLVNPSQIVNIATFGGQRYLELKSGSRVPVSRRKKVILRSLANS